MTKTLYNIEIHDSKKNVHEKRFNTKSQYINPRLWYKMLDISLKKLQYIPDAPSDRLYQFTS